jgi:DNA repair protein RadD
VGLRVYQRRALDLGVYDYFAHNGGNPVISLPTGSGKTHVIAQLAREAIENKPDCRIVVLAHVKELLRQNHDKMLVVWPEAPVGVYSAGLERREIKQITNAGIQSIWKRAEQLGAVDIAIVDEAHRISAASEGRYRSFLDDLEKLNPAISVIGFTATPFRLKTGYLHAGKDALFDTVSYEQDIVELIDQGFLAPLIPKRMKAEIDTTGVHTRAGEFDQKELEQRVANQTLLEAQVEEILKFGKERKSWLAFCVGVAHAESLAFDLCLHGIAAKVVVGTTPTLERDKSIEDFKEGRVRCIVSVGVLSEGFDAPNADLLVLLRPTKSTGLYVQQLGRGMRSAPDKKDCLVLDFAGNVFRHGPLNNIKVKERVEGRDQPAPQKTCPECQSIVPAGCRECLDCGYVFPAPKPELSRTAGTLELIEPKKKEPQRAWVTVLHTTYSRHQKHDRPDSLCVTYSAGMMSYREWVCLEHDGYPRRKAHAWWRARSVIPPPATVAEALQRTDMLKTPRRILVEICDRFPVILEHDFGQQTSAGT